VREVGQYSDPVNLPRRGRPWLDWALRRPPRWGFHARPGRASSLDWDGPRVHRWLSAGGAAASLTGQLDPVRELFAGCSKRVHASLPLRYLRAVEVVPGHERRSRSALTAS